jgi:uncharacterized protein (TIGR02453 family)
MAERARTAKAEAETQFFGPDALEFLRELKRNNDRAWFQKNKTRYESSVQGPALQFIARAAPFLSKLTPYLVADARPFGGSLSRIYRDTRFSKDKSPYKTHVGIHFSHGDAAQGENLPGFFFHIAPGDSLVASGIWHPAPPALRRIRDAIVRSPKKWAKVLEHGVELGGESYVRVPTGYDASQRYSDDLRRKDFFASRPIDDSVVTGPALMRSFEATCRQLNPLNVFLSSALEIAW